MNKSKSILATVLIFAFTVPCFGKSTTIKRKKNKWFFVEGRVKATNVNRDNQPASVPFIY
jgi:hypothetical protein